MTKILYIIDIKKRQKKSFNLKNILKDNIEILSLTPYSCYLLDVENKKYHTFHSLISIHDFKKKVFGSYSDIEPIFQKNKNFGYLFRNLALIRNYEIYINILFDYIHTKKENNYKVIYLSDAKKETINKFEFTSNNMSGLYYCDDIDEFKIIQSRNKYFYLLEKIRKIFYTKNLFNKIINHLFNKSYHATRYDNNNFNDFWDKLENIKTHHFNPIYQFNTVEKNIINILITKDTKQFIFSLYKKILNDLRNSINTVKNISSIKAHPFIYLSDNNNFILNLLYKNNNIPRVFMQHGSYVHEHIFLKYNEIYPSDLNLVFNDYTKNLFLKNNHHKVYTVGSTTFNKTIKLKDKKYDFTYITYCTHYGYNGTYIDSKVALHSMDSNNMYERHKQIIELFSTKFKDTTLCIKMQAGIVDNMLYTPLLELSQKYKNITIEFFRPLHNLIEESRYIISDYFSSEFINRDIHYQRDIILFQDAPMPLPAEILSDMEKMFILVSSLDDFSNKIENIENITKNRARNDAIIEFYSSKKCDTKKVVTEILEKEFSK